MYTYIFLLENQEDWTLIHFIQEKWTRTAQLASKVAPNLINSTNTFTKSLLSQETGIIVNFSMIKKGFKTPRTLYYGIYLLQQLQKRNVLQNEGGKPNS